MDIEKANLARLDRFIADYNAAAAPGLTAAETLAATLAVFEEFYADDFTWTEAPIPDLFPDGRGGGRAELAEAAKFVCAALATRRYTLVDAFAAGDRVAAELVYDAVRRDGEPVRLRIATLYRWRDGRVAHASEYPCRAVAGDG